MKRARIAYPESSPMDARRKKAIAIAAKLKAKYPYAEYGRSYTKRGSAESLTAFGPTYREANEEQKARRKQYGYIGRGKYHFKLRNIVGKKVTRALQDAAVQNIQAYSNLASSYAGPQQQSYEGSGAYTANNLITNALDSNSIASYSSSIDETGDVIITHKEFLTDILGPPSGSSFTNRSFALNPALEQSFPFLSQIACNYAEYEFIQLIYHYRSTTTDIGASTNGQCGTVIMCTNYNPSEDPFNHKSEMLQYAHAMSVKTTEHMDHGVECDPKKTALSNVLYTRTLPVSTEDLKNYDHGTFQLAISNTPVGFANEQIGELWVTYKVRLSKPRFGSARGTNIQRELIVTPSSAAKGATATGASIVAAPLYYGTFNNMGLSYYTDGAWFRVRFPASFQGYVRYTIITTAIENVATSPLGHNIVLAGNLTEMKEVYSQNGQPSSRMISSAMGLGNAGQDICSIVYFFVGEERGGVANTISVTGQYQNSPGLVQSMIEIMEYNPAGKNSTNDILLLKNSGGQIIAGDQI